MTRLALVRVVVALIALAAISIAGLARAATPKAVTVANNATEISWQAATTNTDGTPLTNLAGYHIWHGVFSHTYEVMPATVAADTLQYVLPKLVDGDHFFAVSAFNAEVPPKESDRSAEINLVQRSVTICVSPLSRQQACVAPLVGSWTQTQQFGPPPACEPGGWTPTQPPAGVCAEPPTQMLTTGATTVYEARSATMPLALIGLTAIGQPCGPETLIRNGVKYCGVPKSAIDAVVWPADLAGVIFWVRAAP